MLSLSCLCGQIRVETAKQPDFIHECNCTLCSKSGARWGYFHPSEVNVEGAAEGYCREDKEEPGAVLQFCAKCGVTTSPESSFAIRTGGPGPAKAPSIMSGRSGRSAPSELRLYQFVMPDLIRHPPVCLQRRLPEGGGPRIRSG